VAKVDSESSIEAARAALYTGIVDDDGAKVVFKCSQRTLERHVSNGLPFVKLGNKRFFVIERAREWLITRQRSYRPRSRGRPRREARL
jgi:hypothetical protein